MQINDENRLKQLFIESYNNNTFIKCTLSRNREKPKRINNIHIKLIETPKLGKALSFLYRYKTGDITKNFTLEDGIAEIFNYLDGEKFSSLNLMIQQKNFELIIAKDNTSKLKTHKLTTEIAIPSREHNRKKKYLADLLSQPFIQELGIVNKNRKLILKKTDKYKQLQNILILLEKELKKVDLPDKELTILDMGCGKGYLTFVLYYYFTYVKKLTVKVVGVDKNAELMKFCNKTAKKVNFEKLSFVNQGIKDFTNQSIDIMFSLHACDTATDEALYKAIVGDTTLIFSVPCCQKEIRPQLTIPIDERSILKHDVYKDRISQIITDSIRSLELESQGYKSSIIQFISDEHTHRNNMIIARKSDNINKEQAKEDRVKLMTKYGIKFQKLRYLLSEKSE